MALDYSHIGRNIAKRRKTLGLTQAKAAERSDITEKYFSNIERAKSIPSTEVVMRIALALETTPDELLVGTFRFQDEHWKDVAQQLQGLTPGQLKLVEDFIALAAEQDL